jgi:cytoskeletal protein CcmA (bactofilin family)
MGTYVNNLRLLEITTGDESGTWGTKTNTNLELIADAFGSGTEAITTNADTHTTTIADGAADEGRAIFLKYTGTLDSACTITIAPNTVNKVWLIENATSGSQNIIISQGSGANITIGNGKIAAVLTDGAGGGAAVLDAFADLELSSTLTVAGNVDFNGALDVDGTTNLDAVDIDGAVQIDSTVTVGVDDTGYDVKFFGDTASAYMLWDTSADDLVLAGAAGIDLAGDIDVDGTANLDVVDIDGAVDMASTLTLAGNADFNGDLDVDGTTNLDVVDIDGAVDMATTLAVAGNVDFNGALDVDGTTNLDVVDIDGAVDMASTLTVHSNVSMTVADNSAGLQVICTDADASAGPLILLDRDTASPADGDTLGRIYNQGRNDADELITYAQITTKSNDVTDGTEDGELLINVMTNGSATSVMSITGGEIQMDATAVDLNGTLDVSGTSTLTGNVSAGADVIIGATDKLRLDGSASGNTYLSESAGDVVTLTTEGIDSFLFASSGGNPYIRLQAGNTGVGAIQYYENDGGSGQVLHFQAGVRGADNKYYISSNATIHTNYAIQCSGEDVAVGGALSKGSGSFKIDHPLPSMKDTHDLYHSFIEGPRADLIYRGQIDLVDGQATVEMNAEFGMTAGTWELLCRDATCFTTNETGWDMVKGSVSGSTLTIQCQESDCTDTVSWLVVAERQDQHMYDTEWTDSDGRPILEREKPEEVEDL